MSENELKLLWQSANEKIEQNTALNQINTSEISKLKIQNLIATMTPIKIFALIVGILWVLILGTLVVNLFVHAYDEVSMFFLYSAAIQVVLTAFAIAIYIYQLDLIHKLDFSEPILGIQKKLTKLKIATLNVTRVLMLQLPLWTTFYLSESIFKNGNTFLLLIQLFCTLLFTYIAIWFFINIKMENKDKKWFKWIFSGKEWQPLIKSMELLDQIKNY